MRAHPPLSLLVPAVGAWAVAAVLIGVPDAAAASSVVAAVLACAAVAATWLAASRGWRTSAARAVALLALLAGASAVVGAGVAVGEPLRSPASLERAAGDSVSMHVELVVDGHVTAARSAPFGAGHRVRFPGTLVAAISSDGGASPGGRSGPVVAFGAVSGKAPVIGSTIRCSGTIQRTSPGEDSAFLFFADDTLKVLAEPPMILGWAEKLRSGLHDVADRLPGDGGDLLPGLAIGDTSSVTDELDTAMKHSALSHLTAVSGANCAVVVALVALIAGALNAPRWLRVVCALVALGGFVVLVTPEPSVVRAAVMAALVLFAFVSGRVVGGIAALAAAVILILTVDPWLARDVGFVLSALATFGLLVFAPPLAALLARWMPRTLALAVAVPLAAQVACQPILVLLDPTLPISGIAANMLAEPAAPLATILGLASCLVIPVLPSAGAGIAWLAWVPATWIAQVARTVDGLPFGRLPWIGGAAGVVITAVVVVLALWLVIRGRAAGGRRPAAATLVLLLIAGAYGGSLAGASVSRLLTRPSGWMFAACDIGQGDAVLVQDGDRHALVDVGPDPKPLAHCLDELGVRRIDLLVLTHYDLDHVGGVDAVVGRVDQAIVGLPGRDADTRIPAKLSAGGARVVRGVAGMSGRLGELDWRVIWPEARARDMMSGNDGSVTVTFSGRGVRSIFLGDLGEDSQNAMMAAARPRPVDVVKVAHHGSADQSEELYHRLRARVGLISVGVDNGYGHPTAKLLGILVRTGTDALRTDLQGMILIAPGQDGTLRTWSERRADAPDPVGGPG